MAEARKHDCVKKEHAVKKDVSVAVASFANSKGGKLFIGIQDDPVEVVGLESDLSVFKNFDKYIRAIQDSVKSFTKNQSFVHSIKFQHGEDRKFLVLHVPTGGVPIFIHDNDKEEFYTRGHGESCLCQHTDAHRWITERFPDWRP
jgi:predicted HTH transcriptional regulator